MEQLELIPMSRELCHEFYRGFENDPAIFMDMEKFYVFRYDPRWADDYFDRQMARGRKLLAIMLDGRPIGEVKLWDIDREKGICNLGIHMQNDAVKGRGFGTWAEREAAEYAFRELGMNAVLADVVVKNTRSQRALEKAGFRFVEERGIYRYYRRDRENS